MSGVSFVSLLFIIGISNSLCSPRNTAGLFYGNCVQLCQVCLAHDKSNQIGGIGLVNSEIQAVNSRTVEKNKEERRGLENDGRSIDEGYSKRSREFLGKRSDNIFLAAFVPALDESSKVGSPLLMDPASYSNRFTSTGQQQAVDQLLAERSSRLKSSWDSRAKSLNYASFPSASSSSEPDKKSNCDFDRN